MKKIQHISPEHLRIKLFLYLAVILFVFSLFLILTIANPIYDRLKKSEHSNVHHDVSIRTMAVNEWARRAMDLAVQVTSRTRIRQELERYNNKEISLTQLKSFTEPRLSDAMNLSIEIIGITRLDKNGIPVAQCGEKIPSLKPPMDYTALFKPSFSPPFNQNGHDMIVVSTPIHNRSKTYVGADLVVIDLCYLKKIVMRQDSLKNGNVTKKGYEIILGYISDKSIDSVFSEIDSLENIVYGKTDTINRLLLKSFNGEEGMVDSASKFVAAYHYLMIENWGLVILKNKNELYRPLNIKLRNWGLFAFLVYILSITGFWFLMSPLANRLLLHTDELKEKINEQTRHLEEEINERKRIASSLEKSISNRKKAEEEMRILGSRYQSIVQTAMDGFWRMDSEGHILEVNPSYCRMSGYDESELLQMKIEDLECNEDSEKVKLRMQKIVVSGHDRFESRHCKKDDSIMDVEVLVQYRSDGGGQCVCFIKDITEQKKTVERLQQAQKMESIGSLAGGIAHDFNNILFPILGMSELLLEDLPIQSSEHESVLEILKAGKRGAALVDQILAFSRQGDHKIIPVQIQKILIEVLKLTRSTIPSNIEMIREIQQDCGQVMADPTQIHQVAMNIITNAFHAVEADGGIITTQLKEIHVQDDHQGENEGLTNGRLKPGTYAHLSFRDNGPGISAEVLEKIFEPYFTTKKQGKGTGLGLAVVYGIIKAHQGEIKVESRVEKGTTFHIYLPIMENEAPIKKTVEIQSLPTGHERILLVDDERPVALIEEQMLNRLGYHTTVCTDSLDALLQFSADPYRFDLVITDVTMPNLTGDRLAKDLMAIRPELPIIVCTGFSERMNKEKAETIGIKGVLKKPIDQSDLANMVRKVLDDGTYYSECQH